jgi:hypothetical protein
MAEHRLALQRLEDGPVDQGADAHRLRKTMRSLFRKAAIVVVIVIIRPDGSAAADQHRQGERNGYRSAPREEPA